MKTKSKISFKDLLEETGRKQYVTDDVVSEVEPSDAQEIQFFSLDKYVSANDLEGELAKQGYELAHPYALALYAKKYPDFADDTYIATQWKDKSGEFCFAAFNRWRDERSVDVSRRGDWDDDWWFAGVRKHPDLRPSDLSSFDPAFTEQSDSLKKAIEICKLAGLTVSKIY